MNEMLRSLSANSRVLAVQDKWVQNSNTNISNVSTQAVANLQQYFGEGGTKYWALSKGMMGDQIAKIE